MPDSGFKHHRAREGNSSEQPDEGLAFWYKPETGNEQVKIDARFNPRSGTIGAHYFERTDRTPAPYSGSHVRHSRKRYGCGCEKLLRKRDAHSLPPSRLARKLDGIRRIRIPDL